MDPKMQVGSGKEWALFRHICDMRSTIGSARSRRDGHIAFRHWELAVAVTPARSACGEAGSTCRRSSCMQRGLPD
eukprot:4315577-Pleurochrysis_carterae.AAC.1